MSESVRHLWVLSLNASASMYQVMTDVSALNMKSSEQPIEMGMPRRSRDYLDCQNILEWLQIRNLFQYDDQNLHSLSLGLVSDGKDEINFDKQKKYD